VPYIELTFPRDKDKGEKAMTHGPWFPFLSHLANKPIAMIYYTTIMIRGPKYPAIVITLDVIW